MVRFPKVYHGKTMAAMKRYLEQLQDELDNFAGSEDASNWVKDHDGYEYTPITNNNGNRESLPSLVIQKLRSVFR